MFTGEYRPSVDEKGRLSIPTKLRKGQESDTGDPALQWVFSYGYDHCIMGMPLETWNQFIQEKIAQLPKSVKENRQRIRFFLSGAYECELDKQGRFVLPQNLREYASLSKDIVIIGVGEYIEIWDAQKYAVEVVPDQQTINDFSADFWS